MKKQPVASGLPLGFLLSAAALLIAWFVLYEGYLKALGQPDAFLTKLTAAAGRSLLSAFGYSTNAVSTGDGILLLRHSQPLLKIADNCNGLAVFTLFAGFVAVFQGSLKNKIWYIPTGLLLLFLLNVVRVTALVVIYLYQPGWVDFNHKYTFTLLMYACVFGLWMLWVNKFATLQKDTGVPTNH